MRFPGFELPEAIGQAQPEFDDELAKALDAMADRFQGKPGAMRESQLEDRLKHLEQTMVSLGLKDVQGKLPEQFETFLTLSLRLEELATSLERQI
jgi:hypothetical protein